MTERDAFEQLVELLLSWEKQEGTHVASLHQLAGYLARHGVRLADGPDVSDVEAGEAPERIAEDVDDGDYIAERLDRDLDAAEQRAVQEDAATASVEELEAANDVLRRAEEQEARRRANFHQGPR